MLISINPKYRKDIYLKCAEIYEKLNDNKSALMIVNL